MDPHVLGVEHEKHNGHTPDFVLQVSSRSAYQNNIEDKKALYATVREAQEYYIYDPEAELELRFMGYRLIDGVYHEIAFVDSCLRLRVLGLELGEREGVLRLYDIRT